jgi:Protein of unknown function (DUF3040)
MALSMDEQRILDEMERRLAEDDPRLAARLASLGGPGVSAALRSPRSRLVLSVLALALVVAVALMAYAMIPLRAATGGGLPHHTAQQRSARPVTARTGAPAAPAQRGP